MQFGTVSGLPRIEGFRQRGALDETVEMTLPELIQASYGGGAEGVAE